MSDTSERSDKSDRSNGYASGAAALFASLAREGRRVVFVSKGWLFHKGITLICQGDVVEGRRMTGGMYEIGVVGLRPVALVDAGWINSLAGMNLVEEV